MKTVLLLSAFVFIGYQSQAQINEGRLQVGGSLGVTSQNDKSAGRDYKTTNAIVSPSIGYFYKTNRMAGLFLNFGYNEAKDYNSNHVFTRSYGGGIYLRQYQPVLNKLYIFLHENAGYDYVATEVNGFNTHYYNIGAALQTGMAYDITKKMQLEISLNNLMNAYYRNGSYLEGYGISTSLEKNFFSNIGFGFRYYLK